MFEQAAGSRATVPGAASSCITCLRFPLHILEQEASQARSLVQQFLHYGVLGAIPGPGTTRIFSHRFACRGFRKGSSSAGQRIHRGRACHVRNTGGCARAGRLSAAAGSCARQRTERRRHHAGSAAGNFRYLLHQVHQKTPVKAGT